MSFRGLAAFGLMYVCAQAQSGPSWRFTHSAHFELYSQADDAVARSTLTWFEQLREFYIQKARISPAALAPVRVIAFRTARDYEPYRLRPSADAHYIGSDGQDYIVLPNLGPGEFAVAAHEYAHSFLHAAGLKFPAWLNEGMAEFFATVRITAEGCKLGGDLPARSQALQRHAWIPMVDLLQTAPEHFEQNRESAGVYYSEAWALTDMLMLSEEYGARFGKLVTALALETPSASALKEVYGKSLDTITKDLRAWTAVKHPAATLSPIEGAAAAPEASREVSPHRAQAMLGDMLLAAGDLDRAEEIFSQLERDGSDPSVFAALGNIALRRGDKARARDEWKRAIDSGLDDPKFCYQYFTIGQLTGVPEIELRPALERAIALKPDFDDARFNLALIEKNSGDYEGATRQLRAMQYVAPFRAFHYWTALADALVQLDRRDEAEAAAKHALEFAATSAEKKEALQIAYMAQTDLAVQFVTTPGGEAKLQTTRVPHNTLNNPFVEPGDLMRHAEGSLREIDCASAATRFVIDTGGARLTLVIADSKRVEMRNAPEEFTCGHQARARRVAVDYAVGAPGAAGSNGVIRGMEFR